MTSNGRIARCVAYMRIEGTPPAYLEDIDPGKREVASRGTSSGIAGAGGTHAGPRFPFRDAEPSQCPESTQNQDEHVTQRAHGNQGPKRRVAQEPIEGADCGELRRLRGLRGSRGGRRGLRSVWGLRGLWGYGSSEIHQVFKNRPYHNNRRYQCCQECHGQDQPPQKPTARSSIGHGVTSRYRLNSLPIPIYVL